LGKQFRDGKKTYVALGPVNQLAVVNMENLRGRKMRACWPAFKTRVYGPADLSSRMSQSDLRDFLRPCYQRDFL
jgi:hypothetical protein